MPITPTMRTPVSGSVILLLNPSPKKKSTTDYVAGSMEQNDQRDRMSAIAWFHQTRKPNGATTLTLYTLRCPLNRRRIGPAGKRRTLKQNCNTSQSEEFRELFEH
jgi:hypothetical protein